MARLDGIRVDTAETAREGIANAIASADGAGTHAQALVRAARDRRPEDARRHRSLLDRSLARRAELRPRKALAGD